MNTTFIISLIRKYANNAKEISQDDFLELVEGLEEDEIEAFYFTVEYDCDDSPFIVFINHGNAKEPIKNTNAVVDFLHNIYETELKDSVNKNSIEYIFSICM